MYALYAIGPGLERYYGRSRYLLLYILAGFAGNVASFLISPQTSLGASTAIFGLLGAEGVFLYQNRQLFGPAAKRSLTNVIMIAAVNLMIGLSPGIDNWGHVGGLIGGIAVRLAGRPALPGRNGPVTSPPWSTSTTRATPCAPVWAWAPSSPCWRG